MNIVFDHFIAAALVTSFFPLLGFVVEFIVTIAYKIVAKIFGEKFALVLFDYTTFLGVFHHELSHALLAIMSGAQVIKVVLFQPKDNRLGYVTFKTRGSAFASSIQNTMIATAPVVCGCISLHFLFSFLQSQELEKWLVIIIWYLIVSIVIHMSMSTEDFRIMWKGLPVFFFIVLFLVSILDIRLDYILSLKW